MAYSMGASARRPAWCGSTSRGHPILLPTSAILSGEGLEADHEEGFGATGDQAAALGGSCSPLRSGFGASLRRSRNDGISRLSSFALGSAIHRTITCRWGLDAISSIHSGRNVARIFDLTQGSSARTVASFKAWALALTILGALAAKPQKQGCSPQGRYDSAQTK